MSSKQPPVPPANRSPKGPGGSASPDQDSGAGKADTVDERLEPEKTGQTANTHVNTTNQGHQQDR